MNEIHQGSCLCGTIRFSVTGKLRPVVYCHCSQCRKQTGHHVAATDVDDAGLAVEGGETLKWYASSQSAKRGFCGNCGSILFWKSNGTTRTSIMAGGFDPPSGLLEGFHIYCEDKGDYYRITDGLEQFQQSD